MAKKVTKKLKLVIAAGKANPAPPIGPALGQAGINIGEFVTKFNASGNALIYSTYLGGVSNDVAGGIAVD